MKLYKTTELSPPKTARSIVFGYRNKMFHHGFEWPADERSKFAKLILSENWPDSWFKAATSDGNPWIYYMTETYISDCVSVTEQIIEAIGRFARQLSNRTAQANRKGAKL